MKILHIIDELLMGGAENLLISLAGEQASRGHDVTVSPLICHGRTPVRDKLEARGVQVIPLRNSGSFYNPLFIIKIARMVNKYDLVHVHLFPALYWAGFARILSFSTVPLIYTEHSTSNKRRGKIILHIVDTIVYKIGFDKVIACSKKALDTFRAAYPTISHTCVINNGIETSVYRNSRPYSKNELLGISNDCFVVTMVARFMTMKRQDTLVDAITKVPNNIHLVFVGGEECDEGLQRIKIMAKEKDVQNRVHFLYIRKDVPQILKTSDVVVMASDYEGLSLSSIEGMAAGKPFIATNVDGLREVVGGAGVLFENRDSEALAHIILKLYTDKNYYQEISDKCAQRAKSFDVKEMVDSYLKVYDEVMNEKQ